MKTADVTEIKVAIARIEEQQKANGEVLRTLARKDDVEKIVETIAEHTKSDEELFRALTGRVNKIENRYLVVTGAASVIGALVGGIIEATFGHKISVG